MFEQRNSMWQELTNIWQGLAGWEKLGVITFSISMLLFLPAVWFRSLPWYRVIILLAAIICVSYIAPTLGFGLAAWGFQGIGYVIFFSLVTMPLFFAWRYKSETSGT
jgi:hypothetical protein